MSDLEAKISQIQQFDAEELELFNNNPAEYDQDAADARLEARFPRNEYREALHINTRRLIEALTEELDRAYTASEVLQKMKDTNFFDNEQLMDFYAMFELQRQPFIALGTCGGTGYAVTTLMDAIHPHKSEPGPPREDMFDVRVLGVNFNVTPSPEPANQDTESWTHREPPSPDDGSEYRVRLSTIDDADLGNGFCFAQIGYLIKYGLGNWYETRDDIRRARDGYWTNPAYGVVLELDKKGQPQGVWIIKDFFPMKRDEDDVAHRNRIDMTTADLLDDGGEEFTVAKIASSLHELLVPNPTLREFSFEDTRKGEVQIVPAKRMGPYTLREWVLPNTEVSETRAHGGLSL